MSYQAVFPLVKVRSQQDDDGYAAYSLHDQDGWSVARHLFSEHADYIVTAVNQHANLVRDLAECVKSHQKRNAELTALEEDRDELRRDLETVCGIGAAFDLRKQVDELKSAAEHDILVHAESHARSVREKDELRADFKRLEHALKGTVHRFLVDDSVQPMCWCREPPDEVHELQCTVARAALRASEAKVEK